MFDLGVIIPFRPSSSSVPGRMEWWTFNQSILNYEANLNGPASDELGNHHHLHMSPHPLINFIIFVVVVDTLQIITYHVQRDRYKTWTTKQANNNNIFTANPVPRPRFSSVLSLG